MEAATEAAAFEQCTEPVTEHAWYPIKAFGPGLVHSFQDGKREKVHLPLIFNDNGVFCSDRQFLLYRLSTARDGPLATFSLIRLFARGTQRKCF